MSGKNFGDNPLREDFKSTINVPIFSQLSIMTTFWKSYGHSTSNGVDLAEF